MIVSRSPYRITLGGGGTVLPSFYQKHGGFCVTMAIDKHMYLTLKLDELENMCKLRYSEIENVICPTSLKHTRAREVLSSYRLGSVEINTSGDLPANTGMGSSGTFLVGLIKTVREHLRLENTPRTVAEEACDIEINRLKEPVGKQDQYISAFGGIQVLDIDKDGNVKVIPVDITKSSMNNFLSNIHVYCLNIRRSASDILKEQSQMKPKVEGLMSRIKEMGYETLEFLENENFDRYGQLLDEYWGLKKQLSNKVSVSAVDDVYEDIKKNFGVLGGKIIGAGGGGFFLVYANKNVPSLDKYMYQLGMTKLQFGVDYDGSKILGNF